MSRYSLLSFQSAFRDVVIWRGILWWRGGGHDGGGGGAQLRVLGLSDGLGSFVIVWMVVFLF